MHRSLFMIILSVGFLLVDVAFLTGCSSPPLRSEQMIPAHIDIEKRHSKTVKIVIVGGGSTEGDKPEQIPASFFKDALLKSLKNAMLFEDVVEMGKANYDLTVFLSTFSWDFTGRTFEVKVRWKISDSQGKTLWEQPIESRFTSTTFDGRERSRDGREGAIRENISEALRKISILSL